MAGNWIQEGDVPRVMIPLDIHPRQVCGAAAARVYAALAYRADNRTGLVDSTLEQIAADADMGRSQAAAGVKRLIADRWIEQVRKGNSRVSNKYRMHAAPTALDRPESRTVDHPENRTVQPSGQSGIPDQTVRNSGPPLVSSLLSPTTSPANGGRDDLSAGSIPGLLVAPTPPHTAATASHAAEFEAFWSAYPKRNGQRVGKKAATREFAKARKTATAEQLLAAVVKYAATCNGYPKDAERFLRDEIWADLMPTPPTGDLTDDEVDELLGHDNAPLPAPPPNLTPGSLEWKAFRTAAIATRRAERRTKAAALRQHTQTTARSIA
ncbi:hypothetical protein [Umezawaea tangerina]|uniref:Helix-turn-helix protein n=1 Tax=Umezawaea tangerina TaxID=84725 RepID=A0A2T0TCA6_9PSEU|nr:hypothetical protein [Umezawaea tangerina]PRY43293.1 hypothetical protein CLV43_10333 [Umezawaea tangerina]